MGVFLLMMFFGIMAMLAYANDPTSYDTSAKLAYLAFFDLILPLGAGWHVVTLIVVTALAASSMDTLQTGIASIFSSDLMRPGFPDKYTLLLSRVFLIVINIPAVIMASKRYNVIMLFLVADLVCGTAVLPVFLGLITEDKHWLLPAPTELGAFLGIWSGIGAVLVNGKVIGFKSATNSITGETIATGPFSYFWLTNDPNCAVCGVETMVTFIIVPLVAGFFTLFFSKLDILIRGERARQPLLKMAQPAAKADNYDLTDKAEEKDPAAGEPAAAKDEGDGTGKDNEEVGVEQAKEEEEAVEQAKEEGEEEAPKAQEEGSSVSAGAVPVDSPA